MILPSDVVGLSLITIQIFVHMSMVAIILHVISFMGKLPITSSHPVVPFGIVMCIALVSWIEPEGMVQS